MSKQWWTNGDREERAITVFGNFANPFGTESGTEMTNFTFKYWAFTLGKTMLFLYNMQ